MNTSEFTEIPQNRERIFIVCFKNNFKGNVDILDSLEKINNTKSIESYFEQNVADRYYYTPKSKIYQILKDNITKTGTIYQYRRVYVRENKSNECPTLTANMGLGGHNVPIILDYVCSRIRKLTPRECFNIQGFDHTFSLPKSISDTNLYKLAGNAVSVNLVNKIADIIVNELLLR